MKAIFCQQMEMLIRSHFFILTKFITSHLGSETNSDDVLFRPRFRYFFLLLVACISPDLDYCRINLVLKTVFIDDVMQVIFQTVVH